VNLTEKSAKNISESSPPIASPLIFRLLISRPNHLEQYVCPPCTDKAGQSAPCESSDPYRLYFPHVLFSQTCLLLVSTASFVRRKVSFPYSCYKSITLFSHMSCRLIVSCVTHLEPILVAFSNAFDPRTRLPLGVHPILFVLFVSCLNLIFSPTFSS
jgi:hypothetical protein